MKSTAPPNRKSRVNRTASLFFTLNFIELVLFPATDFFASMMNLTLNYWNHLSLENVGIILAMRKVIGLKVSMIHKEISDPNPDTNKEGRAKTEANRRAAEYSRALAESSRASSETKRERAEQERAEAENSRRASEEDRSIMEEQRRVAEELRQAAEEARDAAEDLRAATGEAQAAADKVKNLTRSSQDMTTKKPGD